jgi:hypothetical protein
MGRTPPLWKRPSSLLLASRREWRRIATAVGAMVALALVGWLAWQATQRRESVEDAQRSRHDLLKVAATFAAREIVQEIDQRVDVLSDDAKNSDLQKLMRLVDKTPKDESLWKSVEEKLGAFNADFDRPKDSWFINDRLGVQIARSPRSDESLGKNFALRDYFHGQGVDYLPGEPAKPPIDRPHISIAYRSTSTGRLHVAFSVPIENSQRGGEHAVLGVLAMAVDLGEFSVLEKELPKGYEVVLIDLRQSAIDDQPPRRGLVLHRQARDAEQQGQDPLWIGSDLLARIEKALSEDPSQSETSGLMLTNYRDDAITGGRLYSAALQKVVDQPPEGQTRDTHWLILVQEPVSP